MAQEIAKHDMCSISKTHGRKKAVTPKGYLVAFTCIKTYMYTDMNTFLKNDDT